MGRLLLRLSHRLRVQLRGTIKIVKLRRLEITSSSVCLLEMAERPLSLKGNLHIMNFLLEQFSTPFLAMKKPR